MDSLRIQLDWCRDSSGYRLDEHPKYGKRLVANGGPPVRYRPFEAQDAPLRAFAQVSTPTGLLNFASHFGYLFHLGYADNNQPDPPISTIYKADAHNRLMLGRSTELIGENVGELIEAAKLFKRVLTTKFSRLSGGAHQELEDMLRNCDASASLVLQIEPRLGLKQYVRPTNLLAGMLIRLAQVAGAGVFAVCQLDGCGTVFSVGGRTKRRAGSKYCCDAHRIEHNSKKRSARH